MILTREFLTEIGFVQQSEHTLADDGVEVWFQPQSESYIAFYDATKNAERVWPDVSQMSYADLIKQLLKDADARRVEEMQVDW